MVKYILDAKYSGNNRITKEFNSLEELKQFLNKNTEYSFSTGFHDTDIYYLINYKIYKKLLLEDVKFPHIWYKRNMEINIK